MKKAIVLFLLVISTFCSAKILVKEDSNYINLQETIRLFYDAMERGDALARVALLDDDVILMPNGWKTIRGKDLVARVFTADTSNSIFLIKERDILDMAISDSIAYTVNSYYYTYHKKGEPPNWRKTKNVHIWRLNKISKWKLRVDIWNSDTPIDFLQKDDN